MSEEVQKLVEGKEIFPPMNRKKKWTTSHLVRVDDGELKPLLQLIAESKFERWDPYYHAPVWNDGDCDNASFENVRLCEIRATGESRVRGRNSPYGVSGTTEYYRNYYKATKEKRNAYQRERYKQNRSILQQAREPNIPNSHTAELQKKLEAIPGIFGDDTSVKTEKS